MTAMPIVKAAVSRNDDVYECFPCLCLSRTGRVVTVYRESDGHSAQQFSRLIVRTSDDQGATWSDRNVIAATERTETGMVEWNCPRVAQLGDGRLLVLCDRISIPPGETDCRQSKVFFSFSDDDGVTWDEPRETPIWGIVPDRLVETAAGTWLVATHVNEPSGFLSQWVWRSEDRGATWGEPVLVCQREGLNPCEGTILQLPGGELVCYMRENSGRGWPGPKCLSDDDGRTWRGPYDTLITACHRPVAGLLPSGQVMVTHRHQPGGRGPWAKNFLAFRESVDSALATDPVEQAGTMLPLDHDRSANSDSGYSGWVALPGGDLLVVTYIVDDAPLAQIRSYRFREDEF
jgi:hypothetical protein